MINEHVKQSLTYYLDLDVSPFNALMVVGKWGAGKTHFVKNFLDSRGNEGKYHYISLYGLTKNSEIDDLVYSSFHPFLSSKKIKIAGKFLAGLLKLAVKVDLNGDGKSEDVSASLPQVDLSGLLDTNSSKNTVFIFDDLERCKIDVNSILGYINYYVEHLGAKVIIIANESEMSVVDAEKENYKRLKEKVIGETLVLDCDFSAASDGFLPIIKNAEAKNALRQEKQHIGDTFTQAKHENLRALRTRYLTFERFYVALNDKCKNNDNFIKDCIDIIFITGFEISAGQFSQSNVSTLLKGPLSQINVSALLKGKSLFVTEDIVKSTLQKYSSNVFLHDRYENFRTSQFWTEFLQKSLLDKALLDVMVGTYPDFIDSTSPIWMQFYYYWQLTQENFKSVYDAVMQDLANKAIKDFGILLHLYNTLFTLVDHGVLLDKNKQSLFDEAKIYFDDLYAKDELFAIVDSHIHDIDSFRGYAGFGIDMSHPELCELLDYLRTLREQKLGSLQIEQAKNLIEMIEKKQFEDLSNLFDLDNAYHRFSVFSMLDVDEVFRVMNKLDTANAWFKLKEIFAIRVRFSNSDSYDKFLDELPFFKTLSAKLRTQLESVSGDVRVVGMRSMLKKLDDIVEKFESRDSQ